MAPPSSAALSGAPRVAAQGDQPRADPVGGLQDRVGEPTEDRPPLGGDPPDFQAHREPVHLALRVGERIGIAGEEIGRGPARCGAHYHRTGGGRFDHPQHDDLHRAPSGERGDPLERRVGERRFIDREEEWGDRAAWPPPTRIWRRGGGLRALIADVRAGMDGGALALALTNPATPRSAMERVLDLAIGALLRGLAASDDAAPATKP